MAKTMVFVEELSEKSLRSNGRKIVFVRELPGK
jgi:hypothetical protein